MQATIVNTKINRHTGELISREAEGFVEISEEMYYQPLVEMFYESFSKTSHT